MLIVDDEPSIVRSTSLLIRDLGCETATCSDASRIRETIERERPDLVLQDVRMPGLNVERMVHDLRADARFKHLPIVVFTASMEGEEIAERIHAIGVLGKPFRPEALERLLGLATASVAP